MTLYCLLAGETDPGGSYANGNADSVRMHTVKTVSNMI